MGKQYISIHFIFNDYIDTSESIAWFPTLAKILFIWNHTESFELKWETVGWLVPVKSQKNSRNLVPSGPKMDILKLKLQKWEFEKAFE